MELHLTLFNNNTHMKVNSKFTKILDIMDKSINSVLRELNVEQHYLLYLQIILYFILSLLLDFIAF